MKMQFQHRFSVYVLAEVESGQILTGKSNVRKKW